MELFSEVAVEPDRAVIIVTHDNRVLHYGRQIIHMSDGRIERCEETRRTSGIGLTTRRSWESEGVMKSYLLWLVPMSAGLMLVVATRHVYVHQQPLTPAGAAGDARAHALCSFDCGDGDSRAAVAECRGWVGDLRAWCSRSRFPSTVSGRSVNAGDPLFQVDDRHLRAQLALAKTRAASARAQLTKLEEMPRPEDVPPSEAKVRAAKANADRARDEYERARALWFRRAISEEETVGKRLMHEEARAAMASSPARA